jgi:serine/threonine-protein kinase
MQCPTCQAPLEESQRFCSNCGTVIQGSDPQAPDPMIGQVLGGKYRVNRLLGEGGMGAVYEGEQQLGTAKRKVAVKTLHPHLSRDPKIKARFEREVGTIAELEHPNTIQVYDFGSTPDGILYIVMEFLQGKSLADLLEKEGAMMPERAAYIMDQICGSLEEAHGRGIVHRDLKPDNVVLVERAGKKDFVKLLDFGIAKRSNEEDKNEQKLTQQGMVLGTPPYMSPEQFTGRPIDARSDIYSLAVMAYEMLTGRLPFQADTAWEWATQHMTAPPIPMETLAEGMRAPPSMRAAVQRSLSKSPDERFQTVREFNEAFAGGGAAQAMRPPMGSRPSAAPATRQRTEMGQPLDVGSAFGPPSPGVPGGPMSPQYGAPPPPMGPMGGVGGPAYTPPQGNVAFPTPAGIPQPPMREQGGGGGRAALLVVAGVIAVASVVAIVFATKGHSGGSTVEFKDNAPAPDPTTVLTTTPPSTDTTSPASTGPTAGPPSVPPLNGTVPTHPTAQPHPTTTATPTHTAPQPTSQPTSQPKYDGVECQKARAFKAAGRPEEAKSWGLACLAKGGSY